MNFHYLWHDVQHGLFHFDSGILYTAKQLFIRPGHAIREFIEGKRVRYFKPLSFVVILATLYGVLFHNFHLNSLYISTTASSPGEKEYIDKVSEWIGTHYSWVTLLTLPFYALGSYLAFIKQGYNYTEHLVLNAFLAGQKLIVHIAAFPLMYIYNETPYFDIVRKVLNSLDLILLVWVYVQFFNQLPKLKAILLSLLSFIILIAVALLTGSLLFAIGSIIVKSHH
jgi:hypothetical protein